MAEESSAGFSERLKELAAQNEKRLKAIQDQIANQWEAQRKAFIDQFDQQWEGPTEIGDGPDRAAEERPEEGDRGRAGDDRRDVRT